MAPQASSQCVVCSKLASDKCGSCKAHVYCGKECQTIDWPKHKHICKDIQLEKNLERAAAIVQPAYLNFRENTWDTPIVKIEDSEDALVTYDGVQLSKKNYFVDFPHKLIRNKQTKMAVLCTLACNEPLAWMHNILQGLLQDSRVNIDEVEVNLHAIPRKTTAVHPNGYPQDNWPGYSHFLLRITSIKSKTQWALDIGGGQFGICKALWQWKDYVNCFLDTTKSIKVYPYGTNKVIIDSLGKLDGNPSMIYGLIGDMAAAMDNAVTCFEKNMNLELSALISSNDNDFSKQKVALLDAIHAAVHNYKKGKAKQITAKYKAVQAYETRHPGVSSGRCIQSMRQLFEQHLARTEQASSVHEFALNGIHHIYI